MHRIVTYSEAVSGIMQIGDILMIIFGGSFIIFEKNIQNNNLIFIKQVPSLDS